MIAYYVLSDSKICKTLFNVIWLNNIKMKINWFYLTFEENKFNLNSEKNIIRFPKISVLISYFKVCI